MVLQQPLLADAAFGTSVDPDTSKTFEDDNFLGHEYSTEFAGRIWTDKTVTTAEDNNFTIKYSALATSKAVTGSTNAPVDVVFVIDTSGSMLDSMSNTDGTKRINAAVDALNTSIKKVMDLNDYTRVAVVAYSDTVETLLPLGRYNQGSRTSGQGYNQTTIRDYFSLSSDGGTLYKHVIPEGSQQQSTDNRSVTGGTNIQQGYYTGLNILASTTSTVVDINGTSVNRVPALIFLSDGAPTFSYSTTSWWAPTGGYEGPGTNPSGNSYYIGNGFKALMTAAYMKEAVNRKYSNDLSIYTVGMGIQGLSGAEKNLAYITLAPQDYWNADNNVASDFRSAWATYITNDGTPRVNVGKLESNFFGSFYEDKYYTVNHPTGAAAQYDIDTNVDALKNLVKDYYDADDADTVTQVFDAIVSEISLSVPEVPTEVRVGETLENGGWLTYTDPIGYYMEVKGTTMNFLYKGTNYTVSDTDKDGVFTFDSNAIVKGADGQDYELNLIKITLTADADGFQTLKVEIPAILIPLRVNEVKLDPQGHITTHTHNGVMPSELTYKVGIISDVYDAAHKQIRMIPGNASGQAWSGEKLAKYQAYLAANTNPETGDVSFYTNLFTGTNKILNNFTGQEHTVGDATVTFEPSHTNAFYYIQEKIYVYADKELTQLATDSTLDDNKTYYYKEVFYHQDDIETKAVARTGLQLKSVETVKEAGTGYWYRQPESIRKNKLQLFENEKDANVTGTAQDYYASEFIRRDNATSDHDGYFMVHLGNNGIFRVASTGNLTITKVVTSENGVVAPDKEFTFTVDLTGANGNYSYRILDAVGTRSSVGMIADGGTITLKNGQTVEITNLPGGAGYEITEASVDNFTTSAIGASGTIAAGLTMNAVFTNHFAPDPVVVNEENATLDFAVKKILNGRVAQDSDHFTFIMESNRVDTPMPAGATLVPSQANPTHRLKEITIGKDKINDVNGSEIFEFGKIEYTTPGTYVYTISERVNTPGLAGVSYSGAMYQVTVVIGQDANGALTKDVTMAQVRNDHGTADNVNAFTGTTAVFTNTFKADEVEWTPVGTKEYKDLSGTNPLKNNMFVFHMTPHKDTPNAPMPSSAVNNVTKEWNIGPQIAYDSIIFTQHHLDASNTKVNPKVYKYVFTEELPAEAVAANQFTVNGMKYDSNTFEATVKVYYNSNMEIVVEPSYKNGLDEQFYDRVEFFNEYNPTSVTLGENAAPVIEGTKTLIGRNWKANDSFEFVLGATDEATRNAIAAGNITGVNVANMAELKKAEATTANHNFAFSGITFTKPGTYKFEISETKGNLGGVTYDGHKAYITVVVADTDSNGDGQMDGKLVATVSYDNSEALTDADKAVANKATFTNSYAVGISNAITITGTKTLTGRDMNAGEFFLNVRPQLLPGSTTEYAPMGDSHPGNAAPAAADGVESAAITLLNNVKYDKAGTYEYLITEHIPSAEQKHGGVTYDENTVYRVIVNVVDNQDGQLVATAEVEKSEDKGTTYADVTATDIKFFNSYKAAPTSYSPIHLWKQLEGMELTTNAFTFKAEEVKDDNNGMELDPVTEVGNLATGEIIFGDITFNKAGVYRVKVTEVIPANRNLGMTYSNNEFIVEFDVVDNGYGELEVTRKVVNGDVIFVNVYETEGTLSGSTNLKVQKEFTGRENNAWLASDKFTFVLEPENDAAKAGVLDGTIDMNAAENGLPAKMEITIENATEAQGKAFSDIVFTKAGVYTFKLYEDATQPIENVAYDKAVRIVTVTAEDNGDGTMDVTAVISGGTLTFKNVYEKPVEPAPVDPTPNNPTPEPPKVIDTGDKAFTRMWTIMAIASLTVCAVVFVQEKKRKENE